MSLFTLSSVKDKGLAVAIEVYNNPHTCVTLYEHVHMIGRC